MGQEVSTQKAAAEQHALKGWPAFMNGADMRAQMLKFRIRRSVLGRRVRLLDPEDGCIEYARLVKRRGGRQVYYFQRMDGPCSSAAPVPKFPWALAAHEIEHPNSMPYEVTVQRDNHADLLDRNTNKCASYRRSSRGIWIKTSEECRETRHQVEILAQRARLQLAERAATQRDTLLGHHSRRRSPARGLTATIFG